MGMYTEIFVNVDLKQNTPDSVIEVLKAVCDIDVGATCLADKPHRWKYLFNNGSYYTPYTCVGKLTWDSISEQYSLIGKGDIKNYEGEIEAFFEFIKPWATDNFIGYYRQELDPQPTLVFVEDKTI